MGATRIAILVAVAHLAALNLTSPRTTETASKQPLGIQTVAAVTMMGKPKLVVSHLQFILKPLGMTMEPKRVSTWVQMFTAGRLPGCDVAVWRSLLFLSVDWLGAWL